MIKIKKKVKYFLIILLVLITFFMLYYFNCRRISNVISRIEYLYLEGKDTNDYVISEAEKIVTNEKEKNSNDYFILGYYNLKISENKELAKEYFEKTIENKNKKTSKFAVLYSYFYLCENSLENGDVNKAIQYYKEGFESLNPDDYNKYKKMIWDTSRGLIDTKDGTYEVLNIYNKMNEYSYKLNNKNKLYVYERLATIDTILNKYASAMEDNLNVIDYAIKTENKESRYKAIINLGILAKEMGQYNEALKTLNYINNIDINNKSVKSELIIYKLINMSEIEAILGNYDKSLSYISEIDKYKDDINERKYDYVKILEDIIKAKCLSGKGNFSEASNLLDTAKENISKDKVSFLSDKEIIYYYVLADLYFKEKNYNEAIKAYEKLMDLSKEECNLEYLERALEGLIKSSSSIGNYEQKDKYIDDLLYLENFINKNFEENYYKSSINEYENNITKKENNLIKNINLIFKFLIIILFLVVLKLNIYPVLNKLRIKKKIQRYIREDGYLLYYQPIVDPKKEQIVGFEALLRLKLKDKIIMPNIIINDIEKADMMSEVSIWILNRIMINYEELSKIKSLSDKFYVSMNISLKEIENTDFVENLITILHNSGLSDQRVGIEITENNIYRNQENAKNNIEHLRENGFFIALDDFGVEYSNLSMLEKFNFDVIKLDKCFIDNIEESDVNKSIIETSDYLSCTRNKTIIVEGVESKNQVDFIKDTKSNKIYIQGYFYSKPLCLDDLKKLNLFNRK
ncbi:EAL domain-containing protein [Clostridium perfringens]|nr:EAL domain-containing protein [Clostridium perfringens]